MTTSISSVPTVATTALSSSKLSSDGSVARLSQLVLAFLSLHVQQHLKSSRMIGLDKVKSVTPFSNVISPLRKTSYDNSFLQLECERRPCFSSSQIHSCTLNYKRRTSQKGFSNPIFSRSFRKSSRSHQQSSASTRLNMARPTPASNSNSGIKTMEGDSASASYGANGVLISSDAIRSAYRRVSVMDPEWFETYVIRVVGQPFCDAILFDDSNASFYQDMIGANEKNDNVSTNTFRKLDWEDSLSLSDSTTVPSYGMHGNMLDGRANLTDGTEDTSIHRIDNDHSTNPEVASSGGEWLTTTFTTVSTNSLNGADVIKSDSRSFSTYSEANVSKVNDNEATTIRSESTSNFSATTVATAAYKADKKEEDQYQSKDETTKKGIPGDFIVDGTNEIDDQSESNNLRKNISSSSSAASPVVVSETELVNLSDGQQKQPEATTTTTTIVSSQPLPSRLHDLIVVYRDTLHDSSNLDVGDDSGIDARGTVWKNVSLAAMELLGYNDQDEILRLDPAALDFVVSENIKKPKMGIPSRWMKPIETIENKGLPGTSQQRQKLPDTFITTIQEQLNREQEQQSAALNKIFVQSSSFHQPLSPKDVPVNQNNFTTTAATTATTATSTRRSTRNAVAISQPTEKNEKINIQMNDNDEEPQRRRPERRTSVASTATTINSPTTSERRRVVVRDDDALGSDYVVATDDVRINRRPERSKIYAGRPLPPPPPSRQGIADSDNDPPATGPWPDMESFRSLLRSEAAIRLRILGDDFITSIKEESDWRHDLYKNWLWTLHNGIGGSDSLFGDSTSNRATASARKSPRTTESGEDRRRRLLMEQQRERTAKPTTQSIPTQQSYRRRTRNDLADNSSSNNRNTIAQDRSTGTTTITDRSRQDSEPSTSSFPRQKTTAPSRPRPSTQDDEILPNRKRQRYPTDENDKRRTEQQLRPVQRIRKSQSDRF